MIKVNLEVGKRYARNDGVEYTVMAFATDPVKDKHSLEYGCSDGMWRNAAGEAFPGATRERYTACNTSHEVKPN